jgi:predicted dehydrogenase
MSTPSPVKTGIIGCGKISDAYFNNCKLFPNIELVACADIDTDRARDASARHGVQVFSVEDLLSSSEIEIAINLTIPEAHAEIDCRALKAGRHVFSEKPLALTLAEGLRIQSTAREAGRLVGCAPDTVLGAAVQTCRQLIDEGTVGKPLSFTAVMQGRGHEHWHPSPEFYYKRGGGPMFDMGPYYLHTLITLLGPVKRVAGMTKISFPERLITSEPKKGQRITVEVPTHLASLLEFRDGAIGTLVTSFDVRGPFTNPVIEIYGSEGTLRVPDPNGTGGQVQIGAVCQAEWKNIPHTHGYAKGSRGLGVADMAAALRSGRPHRANDDIAMHALEIMEAIHVSAEQGRHVELTTTCERPEPMRKDLPEFVLE